MSLKIKASYETPNPGSAVADVFRGKYFNECFVCGLSASKKPAKYNLYIRQNNVAFNHRRKIMCDDADFIIEQLRFIVIGGVKRAPMCFFKNSRAIIIPDSEDINNVPAEFHSKVQRDIYNVTSMREIKPGSTYLAKKVSCLIGLNLDYIPNLILKCKSAADLEEMVKYILTWPSTSFQEVLVHFVGVGQVFDVSLLAGIKTDSLCLEDGPFTGFRKLVATTYIPRIKWEISIRTYYVSAIQLNIKKEIAADPECDISMNNTLVNYTSSKLYSSEYQDVMQIAKRNCGNRRFLTAKPIG